MYLSNLIRDVVTQKLRETCVGKRVYFSGDECGEQTILCKDVEFVEDDGNCWIKFIDDNDQEYYADGQGIDIYFEVLD